LRGGDALELLPCEETVEGTELLGKLHQAASTIVFLDRRHDSLALCGCTTVGDGLVEGFLRDVDGRLHASILLQGGDSLSI